ncbi:5'-methylthioadenosine/S-adenosylhomocysteine nucleosidase [Alkalibacillus haloalkaliphilus]|uniref:5'-methylthioadenosine/S-adenosylhomocysteine nucleosidase n=1 Tax=Alkalibacillus haloalkaliphilus TaxID=94136 RepID=UPI002935622D|nr:5'-methylthioadenosine/S-adenosylhomocysteine nucleosidase [Alkalibacillus haloalkaliphilus]MDV2581069.1 5'-methylthioadenosine/S-adenosylhomocysteine nucleosidase [Alkalibacillus haloalkaliphilus]
MKYGIIGAMEEELDWLKSQVNINEELVVANCKFYVGEFAGQEVVLLQSGIGKVNAAISTTILHERFAPDYVINTGSSGGVDPDLDVGDIVIGTETVHHDADATGFGYQYGQIPQMPETFPSNEQLVYKAEKVKEVLPSDVKVTKGLIGTGDSFMSDLDRVTKVSERFPSIKALEMEAVSIAQVCYQYDTPCLIIRSLSDIAGKESDISFKEYLDRAAKNSASFILEMLK